MPTIRKTIDIAAPVDRVFAFVADPRHLPEIWPSLVEVSNVTPHAGGGNGFDWVYKMIGVKVRGHSEDVEVVPNARMVSRSESGIPNTFRWLYEGADGTTHLTVEIDYEVPTPVIGRLLRPLVGKLNELDAETLLRNLKSRMEQPAPSAS
jgi:uncharacterized membrane protein